MQITKTLATITLLAGLASSAIAQVPAPTPETVAPAATLPAVNLPAERTLTSPDGRQMAGTVLSKTDSGIKFRRAADSKEFDIPLDKLSPDDRKFVEALKPAPAARALVIFGAPISEPEFQTMEKLQIEVTLADTNPRQTWKKNLASDSTRTAKNLSEINVNDYDIIWPPHYDRSQDISFIKKCDSAGKIVMLDRIEKKPSKRLLYADKMPTHTVFTTTKQSVVEKNFVFFRCPGGKDPAFYEELIDLSLELFKKQ